MYVTNIPCVEFLETTLDHQRVSLLANFLTHCFTYGMATSSKLFSNFFSFTQPLHSPALVLAFSNKASTAGSFSNHNLIKWQERCSKMSMAAIATTNNNVSFAMVVTNNDTYNTFITLVTFVKFVTITTWSDSFV